MKIPRQYFLLAGLILFSIAGTLLVYSEYENLQNIKDQQCIDLGLESMEDENCCFVNYKNGTFLPKYRAQPCDNPDYVPIQEMIQHGNFPQLNITWVVD